MDLVSPFAAAVAVATTAVSMGLTLLRLCKDCAKAEKEIFHALQDLKNRLLVLDQWQALWAIRLQECRRGGDPKCSYSDIWGIEAYQAIELTVLILQDNYQDVYDILKSCSSPMKTGRTRVRRKSRVPFFIRVFYGDCLLTTNGGRKNIQPSSKRSERVIKTRDKIQWCTSIRMQVNDLLVMIKGRQHDLVASAKQAFELNRSRGQSPGGSVLVEELTISRAVRQFDRMLDARDLVVAGHALIRVRRKTSDSTEQVEKEVSLPTTTVKLPFVAIPQSHGTTPKPIVLLAEICVHNKSRMSVDDGLKVKLHELVDADVSEGDCQWLVEILSKHPTTPEFETRLRRVQMALTICISVFDFYESSCLPVNMSIADIYSYKHKLLSQEESELLYQNQIYVKASGCQELEPDPSPFDHMHEPPLDFRTSTTYDRVTHAKDSLLHRLGIILFEIGRGIQYDRILTALPSTSDAKNDRLNRDHADFVNYSINRIHICDQYKDLVRQCLGGTLGLGIVEAAKTNSAQSVIRRLESMELELTKIVRSGNDQAA